ncbi:MAG: FAD-binding oxidoreductase [Acidobacteriota bacterium]|nr:FAD-binding oxidoreductase [Acidobacteriota bacterium]
MRRASSYEEALTLKAKLLEWKELAPEVHHFSFEVPGVEYLQFTPGQFISVVEHKGEKEVTRAYSIASPRAGNRFELCLNRVVNGLVSPWLFELKPGDEVDMHEPLGYFTLRHPGRRAVFVATGTGVAPFRSMLLDHLPRTQPKITLLFGVRHQEGLLYRDELEQLEKDYASFRFMPTVTRPDSTWAGRTGRVQAHLDEALALRTPIESNNVDVYICGLREMVDDVRKELKARGFDRKQIIYEKYD